MSLLQAFCFLRPTRNQVINFLVLFTYFVKKVSNEKKLCPPSKYLIVEWKLLFFWRESQQRCAILSLDDKNCIVLNVTLIFKVYCLHLRSNGPVSAGIVGVMFKKYVKIVFTILNR